MVAFTLSTGIAIAGAAAAAGGQVLQARAASANAKKQNRLARQDAAVAKRQEKLRLANNRRENDRKRRENLRAFLRQRGETIGGAANRGALGSTGVAGAVQGAQAQFASNEGNLSQAERITADIGVLNQERADIATASSVQSANFLETSARNRVVQDFGSSLFSNAKQISGVLKSSKGLFNNA